MNNVHLWIPFTDIASGSGNAHVWRVLASAVGILLALAALQPAAADPTAETDITVTTQDAGDFTIAFTSSPGGFVFTNSGGGAIAISAISGATATTTVALTWTDTRINEKPLPYTIVLSASDLVSDVPVFGGSGLYTIPAVNLAILTTNGIAYSGPLSTLDSARVIYTSGSSPPADEFNLAIVLQLTVPASMYPTTYVADLIVEVLPGSP